MYLKILLQLELAKSRMRSVSYLDFAELMSPRHQGYSPKEAVCSSYGQWDEFCISCAEYEDNLNDVLCQG